MMISYLSGIRLSILVIIINIPFFFFVGYKALGKGFLSRRYSYGRVLGAFSACKLIPTVTSSELLAVVFGEFCSASASARCCGTAAVSTARRLPRCCFQNVSASTGQIIFMINIFHLYKRRSSLRMGQGNALSADLFHHLLLIDIVQEAWNRPRPQ